MKITREQVLQYVRAQNERIKADIIEGCTNCNPILLAEAVERIQDLAGIFTSCLSPVVIPFYAHFLRTTVKAWMKNRRTRKTVREIAKLFPIEMETEIEDDDPKEADKDEGN